MQGLLDGLRSIGFRDANYHQSELIRLNVINELLTKGEMNGQLMLVV